MKLVKKTSWYEKRRGRERGRWEGGEMQRGPVQKSFSSCEQQTQRERRRNWGELACFNPLRRVIGGRKEIKRDAWSILETLRIGVAFSGLLRKGMGKKGGRGDNEGGD